MVHVASVEALQIKRANTLLQTWKGKACVLYIKNELVAHTWSPSSPTAQVFVELLLGRVYLLRYQGYGCFGSG